jgi:isocitrate dehydrogenase
MVTSRGVKVWPEGFPETSYGDHWRCRFTHPEGQTLTNGDVIELLGRLNAAGLDFIKTEQLYTFNGQLAYSLAQGE